MANPRRAPRAAQNKIRAKHSRSEWIQDRKSLLVGRGDVASVLSSPAGRGGSGYAELCDCACRCCCEEVAASATSADPPASASIDF